MSITVSELEAAGYEITRGGKILKDGVPAKTYIIKGKVNVEVYLPRQQGKSKPWTYVRLHRVVAEKYVPNPHGLKHVAFRKGTSCRWSNLIWVGTADSRNTQMAEARRKGIVLLELGEIGWQKASDKYGIDKTTAYNIWRKVNATV